MAIWDNLKKNEVDALVKFHNQHPETSVKLHWDSLDTQSTILMGGFCIFGRQEVSNANT